MTRSLILLLLAFSLSARTSHHHPTVLRMVATAHSQKGETADGTKSRPGTVAADPAILPLNSRIRVEGAGRYSGVYSVEDKGAKVGGRHIDIYLNSLAEAKKFGKRRVKVVVLRYGDNERKSP
jgi:3D (Asp-Asp-Asp) domain-containing protein